MLNKPKSDFINFILLIGIILFIIEVSFFNGGFIFSLIFSIGCIYFGRKRMPRTSGKIIFWFGWISLAFTVLNMMTIKFLLLAILIYLLIQFLQSKKNPTYLKPTIVESYTKPKEETTVRRRPYFQNVVLGRQKSPEYVYEWDDVNIQCGIGDTIVDLSYTVLPKGESVILIRNLIGNIQVFVPYEVEVTVNHSVFAGTTTIFENRDPKTYNQTIVYQTENYEQAEQKIKIITSMLVGDLEVKRV